MAKLNAEIKVTVSEYRILFLPFAKYCRAGDYSTLSIFGVPVYQRAGEKRNILWWMMPNA